MLIKKYPLKATNAVDLSSGLWLKLSFKMDVPFVASNLGLLKAAQIEKLQKVNLLDRAK
jgi:hypothetical protein